jgi:hypothetical protein
MRKELSHYCLRTAVAFLTCNAQSSVRAESAEELTKLLGETPGGGSNWGLRFTVTPPSQQADILQARND